MGGGEEGLLHDVADSAVADAVAGGDADDGDDGAGDVGELGGEVDGDDGLEVEVEEGLVLIGAVGVEVELEGDGDDVAYGVLGCFGECCDVFGVGRLGGSGVGFAGAWARTSVAESKRVMK